MQDIYGGVLAKPTSDFNAVRDARRSALLSVDVDLSTARSIAANTQLFIPISGNLLYMDKNPELQGVATVHIQDTSLSSPAAAVFMEPGFLARVPFTQLLIENTAQSGKRLRIFYGVDVEIEPGTGSLVQVFGNVGLIDNSIDNTLSGIVYGGNLVSGAAVAAQYSYAQVWNPGGRRVAIDEICFASTASAIGWAITTTALSTAFGNFGSYWGGPVSPAIRPVSLSISYQQTSAVDFLAGFPQIGNCPISTASQVFTFRNPIVLDGGYGLTMRPSAQNQAWTACVRMREIP